MGRAESSRLLAAASILYCCSPIYPPYQLLATSCPHLASRTSHTHPHTLALLTNPSRHRHTHQEDGERWMAPSVSLILKSSIVKTGGGLLLLTWYRLPPRPIPKIALSLPLTKLRLPYRGTGTWFFFFFLH